MRRETCRKGEKTDKLVTKRRKKIKEELRRRQKRTKIC
jgi:hypothetical protein